MEALGGLTVDFLCLIHTLLHFGGNDFCERQVISSSGAGNKTLKDSKVPNPARRLHMERPPACCKDMCCEIRGKEHVESAERWPLFQ